MKVARVVFALAVTASTGMLGGFEAHAQPAAPIEARNVVLVHGAWADGSSWAQVIPRLQAAGLKVTAVQNPLTSLEDSVAATRRALALQDGPTVLVAHSWGGTVISETGIDPKVTALVYVAARAPDAGEDFVALSGKFPTGPVRAGIQEHDGFTRLSEDSFLKYFANGVDFMPCRNLRPPPCSADEPARPRGTPSPHGMQCRNSIRPSIPTWSASWQNA